MVIIDQKVLENKDVLNENKNSKNSKEIEQFKKIC